LPLDVLDQEMNFEYFLDKISRFAILHSIQNLT